MPTGGGKSLCFQIPAIAAKALNRGFALIALMQDQVSSAETKWRSRRVFEFKSNRQRCARYRTKPVTRRVGFAIYRAGRLVLDRTLALLNQCRIAYSRSTKRIACRNGP